MCFNCRRPQFTSRVLGLNPNAMSPITFTAAKPLHHLAPLNLNRPSSFKPLSSFSLRFPPPPLPHFSLRASLSNANPNNSDKPFKSQASNHKNAPQNSWNPFLSPIKTAVVTTIAAAAIFFSGFYVNRRPSIATVISPPANVATTESDPFADEEREKSIEEHLVANPNDLAALKNLMELKIKSKNIPEAIGIIDKLQELEPEEAEWPIMKCHLYAYNGDFQLARNGFYELVKKDPFRVEAYHGLVTVASQEESSEELAIVQRRVEEAIALCKKEKNKSDLRGFKLLLAQIRVLEGEYDDALKFYEELVKEEPRDFRPYLCQGIIYTLLRKDGEAEKSFEKYRRLVPKEHPYASYFDENMIATKLFAQRAENERAAMARN